MTAFIQDLRFAFRLLARQRAFTAVAVLVLALGIGANTAVFGIVNALLLKPRVGHPSGDLVGLYSRDRTQPDTYRAFSYPNYVDLRARTDVFASLSAHNFAIAGWTEGGITRRIFADIVTANFFETFAAPLERGRVFTADEERPGADMPVTILSYGAWQRLGADPSVVGRTITLNARAFTVIGVAPRGFGGSITMASPELWLPTGVYDTLVNDFVREGLSTNLADRRHHNLIVIARLQPGATLASAAPAVEAAGLALEQAYPGENRHQALQLAPLSRMSVNTRPRPDTEVTGVAVTLLVMSGVVLLIASFNLANMLLAQGGARRKELAIRLAIGGSRARLIRQMLTEGLVLSLVGGGVGILLASGATQFLFSQLAALSPIAITFEATPDLRVLLATFGFCTLSTLVFGLLPAWRLARTEAVPALRDAAGDVGGRRRTRFSLPNLLVMGQLACTLVMLAVAGLFLRSAQRAALADPGFSLDRGLMAQLDTALAGYGPDRSRDVYQHVLERVRARPETRAAALASLMPYGEINDSRSVQKAGAPVKPDEPRAAAELINAQYASISADYFASVGLALRRGRDFTAAEESADAGPRVAIIDEPLAEKLFGGDDPLGRQVQYASREDGRPPVVLQVVGVAPGLRQDLFDVAPVPHLYVPFGQEPRTGTYLHVRTTAPSADAEGALLPSLRSTLTAVDARLPILAIETQAMYRARNLDLALVRMGAGLFMTFGAVALFLAAVGVYGVKAYLVTRRTREIGIRLALGATPRSVLSMVLGEGLTVALIGLAAGLMLAWLAGMGLRSLAFEGRGVDGGISAAALLALLAAALLASWLPARRAIRIAPVRALRSE